MCACRFANVARGDKILLRTGHEPLLGVQQQTDRVSKAKTSNTDVERERDAVGKLDDHPSSVTFAVQDDVSIRRGEGESTAPAPTHNISITPSEGREVYVFQKQEEAHVDRQ